MLKRMEQLLHENQRFAFETTLSGLTHLRFIKQAKLQLYHIIMFFVKPDSVELAQHRVQNRVSKGGHNIPANVIERRFYKGIENFSKYSQEVHDWYVYDNPGPEYIHVAKSIAGRIEILNFEIFQQLSGNENRSKE